MSIRDQLNDAIKVAMREKDRASLQTLRMLSAALKQIEVDQRVEITDEIALREFVRQVKQRRDAEQQYLAADRADLAEKEAQEIVVIQRFLPETLSDDAMRQVVDEVIASSGLPKEMSSMSAMMALLKPKLEGRAEMAKVSQYLRQQLQA